MTTTRVYTDDGATISQVDSATTVESPKAYSTKKAIFRTYQVVWYIVGFIEALLAFRFVFRFLGANPSSMFVSFIYQLSYPLVLPFLGIFPTPIAGGSVLEAYTLIAMIVYIVIAYGFIQLFQIIKPTNPQEVEETVNNP